MVDWSSMQGFVDKFARKHTYLRISVTDQCNLDCLYCRGRAPREMRADEDPLSFDDIVRLAGVFAKHGVEKIRISGGEPLLREDLPVLVERLAAIPGVRRLGLTTNGTLLLEKLAALKSAGLTHLNISLDALRASCFEQMTSSTQHGHVMEAIFGALHEGFSPLKLNVVVIRGVNDSEIPDFVAFTNC